MNPQIWKQYVETVSSTRLLNAILLQNGERIAEHHFDEEQRRNVYSVSKSFTSTAIGIAIREGLLSLDEKVVDCLPDKLPELMSDNLAELRIEHLLSMTLGQDRAYLMGGERPFLPEDDWVSYCLSRPFVQKPGTAFLYTNAGPYLAGAILERRAGCTLLEYLMPRLFAPLGIKRPTWETDPMGGTFGSSGLFLTLSEILKLGQLYLQKGMWNGKQLIPTEWVEACKTPYLPVESSGTEHGYGYCFWMGPNGSFRADGKYGQYAIIMEDKNAVFATAAETLTPKSFTNPFWEMVYPNLQ